MWTCESESERRRMSCWQGLLLTRPFMGILMLGSSCSTCPGSGGEPRGVSSFLLRAWLGGGTGIGGVSVTKCSSSAWKWGEHGVIIHRRDHSKDTEMVLAHEHFNRMGRLKDWTLRNKNDELKTNKTDGSRMDGWIYHAFILTEKVMGAGSSGAATGCSGLMVGFSKAFFSFRLSTRPSSGRGRQEGRVRPNRV